MSSAALAWNPPPRYHSTTSPLSFSISSLSKSRGPWSDDRSGPRAALVRYLAPRPEVAGQLKTPSLRNVALTAPYMHEGQMKTLRDVLRYYSTLEGRRGLPAQQERVLVPLHLSPQEEDDLVAFLESLTDTAIEPSLMAPPASPGRP